ncbi:Ion channel [Alloyangia pacifica]|uniref:Ion channel n=1 Tax=Alloyangia pacifica TaxID=311180 RepID=A0A1I6PI38_9RHOB|nr:potassium channel family protein [Alloyangia pacifica]SDG28489.1 Ion channel [Alloyangia pacifica]SFS39882.1 Ion channel [Alloyangia pacifica]
MGMWVQITLGTGLLFLCAGLQLWIIARVAPRLLGAIARIEDNSGPLRLFALICGAFGAMVLAHTLQIWLWAASFRNLGAFETLPEAFYFAVVSYTTLGYGDITLDEGLRIFGTFAAITGLLTFGVSTAFLLAVLTRLHPVLGNERE